MILIVEDDTPVRSVTAEFFWIAGYDVVQAGNTVEAIEVFTGGTVIDLLFSDINFIAASPSRWMESVSPAGFLSIHPGVHIILTSGKSFAGRADAAAFLPKPYRVREVLRLISALLEDPQQRATNEHWPEPIFCVLCFCARSEGRFVKVGDVHPDGLQSLRSLW